MYRVHQLNKPIIIIIIIIDIYFHFDLFEWNLAFSDANMPL